MPDRVVRDELLESERWLDLPTDAARLAFVGFLLVCDDFGNFEGGPRRLYRLLHKFTQIKTEQASAECIDALMGCDLIRRYEADGRELFHIPRFKSHRQYLTRRYPQSPWDADVKLGKHQRVENRGLAKDQELKKNIATTSLLRSSDVAQGVGVGVGELQKQTFCNHREQPVDNFSENSRPEAGKEPRDFPDRSKPFLKNLPSKPIPVATDPASIEKNRRIGQALQNGDEALAERIRDGTA